MVSSAAFASVVRSVQATRTPAAIGALAAADGSTGLVTSGVADLATGRVADDGTLFRAYSVAKPFTGLTVARLAMAGVVDLDEPVNRRMTTLQVRIASQEDLPSLRHLLSHRVPVRADHELYLPAAGDFADLVGGSVRCDEAAPAAWAYSNDGYGVVQQVIEDVTDESFVDVANGVLRELGVEDGGFGWASPAGNVAQPYDQGSDDVWNPVPDIVPSVAAAGCLWLSARDLAALTAALLSRTPPWLEEAMTICGEPHADMPYPELKQGLGWMRRTLDETTYFWHSGAGKGGYAELWVGPDVALGFCVNASVDVGDIATLVLAGQART